MREFFGPTKAKTGVFAGVVALQITASAVGMACGWAIIHGAGVIVCSIILGIAILLVLPAAAISTIWISRFLPSGLFSDVLAFVLTGIWGWMLACAVVSLWRRWRKSA